MVISTFLGCILIYVYVVVMFLVLYVEFRLLYDNK